MHHDSRTQALALRDRLQREIAGDVLFDQASRGRYSTDASIYQIMPVGAVVPRTMADALRALEIAHDAKIPVLARGGGTSQCGQTVNRALVIDNSRYVNRLLSVDVETRTCRVEAGIVLDELNRQLAQHKLWFPVDISTASRATIGGMIANNSCGGRSLRYGTTRDNTVSVLARLADGSDVLFGNEGNDVAPAARQLFDRLLAIGSSEAEEIRDRFPKVQRRVGGYNLDALLPEIPRRNMAHILVGSEGTLAFTQEVELKLSPVLGPRVVGVCHFGSFHAAMDAAQHLVTLKPIAVELVDRTMLELAAEIPAFQKTLNEVVRGAPEALLLVEFAEAPEENERRLVQLAEMMGDLGFGWGGSGAAWGGATPVRDPKLQAALTELRQAGLNIMMSMKTEGKPVSFVEDCAVELKDLAEYTERLTAVFERHGTRGTWYAHASVGCLHVRPVLNIKQDKDVKAMRAIAEEAFALVRHYKGSHSGEHGDGIVRSEFHESMFGSRLVRAFEEVKDLFDPKGLFNPGRIVRPPRMDDRRLFRYNPDYRVADHPMALDWSDYSGSLGGFQGAVEMCNNNGTCRKLAGGTMCPSYRATRDEKDSTRGRANTLRLAISGQIDEAGLASDAVAEALKLCVSCKGCKRDCPTGVDMARMKIEVLAARTKTRGLGLRDRLIAYLPRYAPYAAKLPFLFNLRDRLPVLAKLSERIAGFTARRPLPRWTRDVFRPGSTSFGPANGREVVLMVDTFNRYFDSGNLRAALTVLTGAGYRVHLPEPADKGRNLCCGRTYLSAGLVDNARAELQRVVDTYRPFVERGVPVVGLEPSCLFTLRDEMLALNKGLDALALSKNAVLFEEFLATEQRAGRLKLALKPLGKRVLLHGHCHQKAFAAMGAVEQVLRQIPDIDLSVVETSCCGMAGPFGYGAETYETSMAMAEISLLPALRKADSDSIVIADGTSCREQIAHGAGRNAVHVAQVLADAMVR